MPYPVFLLNSEKRNSFAVWALESLILGLWGTSKIEGRQGMASRAHFFPIDPLKF